MMLFAIVFGLSMDYEVFLLSRVQEEWHRTGDSRTSVADGLAATAKVITAAAAIMVVVFGSFMLENDRTIEDDGHRARRRRSSSTPPSCAWCSCRRRWSCSATGTGGCRAGSTGSCPRSTWKATSNRRRRRPTTTIASRCSSDATDQVPRAVVVGSAPTAWPLPSPWPWPVSTSRCIEAAPTIGGGTRTSQLTLPGVLHDECSAIHPSALASPFFVAHAEALARHGLQWRWPEVQFAHPLDDGAARRCTARSPRPQQVSARTARRGSGRWDRSASTTPTSSRTCSVRSCTSPRHPSPRRFGLRALLPATAYARRWRTDEARACSPGTPRRHPTAGRPMTTAVGLMLAAAGHAHGWPVAVGGSQAITDALAGMLAEAGGRITTGITVTDLAEVPADVTLLDVSPRAAAALLADRAPRHVRRAYRRYRYGPGAFKVDLALEGDIPWSHADSRRAGAVHVGGTIAEIAAAESEVVPRPAAGAAVPARRPAVPVRRDPLPRHRQPDLGLRARAEGVHGRRDRVVLDQIERFAPGFRERIVARAVRSRADIERHNANYVGGDISTGANDPCRRCSPAASPSIRMRPAYPACTCARRRHRREPACTGCAASTPRAAPSNRSGDPST